MEPPEDDGFLKELGEDAELKRTRKNRYALAAFLALVVAGAIALAYAKLGGATKIDHHVKVNRPGGIILQAQQLQGERADQQTEAAIAQAKESRRSGAENNPATLDDSVFRSDSTIVPPPPALPQISMPGEYLDPRGGRIITGGAARDLAGDTAGDAAEDTGGFGFAGANQSGAGGARNRTAGHPRHGASSVYVSDGEETKAPPSNVTAAAVPSNPKLSFNRKEATITLPTFGAMLPVRTLGGVYTLRNSLARLELTRDIVGDGWALRKGTVLIAQQQGGAFDRAYISVTGFIDPGSNRLVKMSGEVLGSDGAPGLKGKRRQISSRWSRAFNRILNIAPGIAQAALARNGGTTVIAPAGGVTSDLIGTGDFSFDRREFVEVEAGAPGYVMVTDLPDAGKGVDADPEKYFADGEQGSLSDEELAKLLYEGAPRRIKAAMPRMTPEMRRVAALAIGELER
ncbi:MAG TPA: hypothetical protein VIM99_17200 [Blastocatellia bacterium]